MSGRPAHEGRIEYRHPPVSPARELSLIAAYARITGRQVWSAVRALDGQPATPPTDILDGAG